MISPTDISPNEAIDIYGEKNFFEHRSVNEKVFLYDPGGRLVYIAAKGRSKQYLNHCNEFVAIDVFLDFLKDKYPDHFEWFLWNPEWLNGE